MRVWIENPVAVYTANNAAAAAGGVVVENGLIQQLLNSGEHPHHPVDQRFDASKHIILPGLINAHHHFYQTLTRAHPAALNVELFDWLKRLYPVWSGLNEEMIYISTQLAAAELLLSGCTLAADHHYIFPHNTPHALDVQVEAISHIGLRAHISRGSMSLGVDQGGLPPQNTVQDEDRILVDSERVLKKYHNPAAGSLLQIALAPCSPFSVSENLMRDSALLARQYNARLHTHLAETHDETQFCLRLYGDRPLDYLERVGWLAADVWLAHGIHFNDEEVQRLGLAGVGICHCPGSNMMLSSGLCRTRELEAAGCPVGLGVDGAASNDHSNLAEEIRQAFLLQRLHYGAENISHLDPLRWATLGSARCLGRNDVGEIALGKQADLALYRLDDARFSGIGEALAAPALCGINHADQVMVGGQWRVVNGQIPGLDMPKLLAQHTQSAQDLLRKS